METIELNNLDLTITKEKLKNGLEVYLIPMENVTSYYITFNTKFGSIYTKFKKNKDENYITIPNGVAHFLEHLTFKLEDGKDASDIFASLGSFSNAYTTKKYTCYEVKSHDKFEENLNLLLDFVQNPCYNEKMVEAEKEIISQEVRMYEDDPSTNLYYTSLKNTFTKSNQRNPIAGTVKEVKKTTLKNIEDAYNTFYHPSNMFILITGNFNKDQALAIIEENQSKRSFEPPFEIDKKNPKETNEVLRKEDTIYGDIELEKVAINIKYNLDDFKKLNLSRFELSTYVSLIISTKIASSSKLLDKLLSSCIVPEGIYYSPILDDNYLVATLDTDTKYPARYITIMKEELNDFSITESDFTRRKKVFLSNLIRGTENMDSTAYRIINEIIEYNQINNDVFNIYKNLDYNIACQIVELMKNGKISITTLEKEEK